MIESILGKMKVNQVPDVVQRKYQVILSKDSSRMSKIREKGELGIYLRKKLDTT